MLFLVHTPKTGGKSLEQGLAEIYQDRLLRFYSTPLKPRANGALWSIPRCLRLLLQRRDVVFGHYSFDGMRWLIDSSSIETKLGMFFREPLHLICSLYFYKKNKYPDIDFGTLPDFVERRQLQDFYPRFLGKYSVDDLDFVGIHERYEQSLDLFGKTFGRRPPTATINVTPKRPDYDQFIDEAGCRRRLESLMFDNIAIYGQALRRFDAQQKADARR